MPIKHGTWGGFQAHRRAEEDACKECKEAAAIYKREYRADKRAQAAENFTIALNEEPEIEERLDELWEQRENLRMVRAAMRANPSPRDMASLSKQRMDLVARITEIESATTEVSLEDELAAVRSARKSRAAGA